MKPRPQSDPQLRLFEKPLQEIINRKHRLVMLAGVIPWDSVCKPLEEKFSDDTGRPALPARLVVGAHYLKFMYNVSDEEFVERWVENPYWQYFCGEQYFQYELPFNPSSFSKWRKRFSDQDLENIFKASLTSLDRAGLLTEKETEVVNVDTTVQEKHVEFPTDRKSLFRLLIKLARLAKEHGISLRQTYVRVAKRDLRKSAVYASRKRYRLAKKYERKIRNYLGRVMRDIARQIVGNEALEQEFEYLFGLAERVIAQSKDKKAKNKVYSIHEPHVECIAKGKLHKQYEFGVKVSVVATSKSGFILSCDVAPGNPHDNSTLQASLDDAVRLLGRESIKRAYVDKGYRGHGFKGAIKVTHAGQRPKEKKIRRELRRRPVIESVISHLKGTCRMARNFLKGERGDKMNAIFAAAAHNFLLLLGVIYLLSFLEAFFTRFATRTPHRCLKIAA
jgi:IS5 family transposase